MRNRMFSYESSIMRYLFFSISQYVYKIFLFYILRYCHCYVTCTKQ